MQIFLKDLLKNSFVITIDNKRYFSFMTNFKQALLNMPFPTKFVGFQLKKFQNSEILFTGNNPNVFNCALSHAAVIKIAQALDLPFVCVFEDDAYPINGIKEYLTEYLSDIPDDIDILKLGWHCIKPNTPKPVVVGKFVKKHVWGAHAYIVFRRYYNTYFKLFYSNPNGDNSAAFNNDMNKIYCLEKNLFIQKNSASDNTLHSLKTDNLLERTQKYTDLGDLSDFK